MLRQPVVHLTIASAGVKTLFGATDRGARWTFVDSLAALRRVLEMTARQAGPATLDLIGHSVRAGQLLRLGTDVIDLLQPRIERFFRALAEDRVLERLDVHALRLIGCETAVQPTAQRTIKRLARVLEMPVFGSMKNLRRAHYDTRGFAPVFEYLLLDHTQLPTPPRPLR